MMTIGIRRLVLGSMLGALCATGWSAGAQAQVANRFVPVAPDEYVLRDSLPPGLAQNEVTVVVLLGADSVATVQSTLGHKLSKSIKENVKVQRVSEQDALKPQIVAKGGRIVGSYQSVINGIKVHIARNRIAELKQLPGVVGVKLVNTYTRVNTVGVPRVQAPAAWSSPGNLHGES